MSLWFTLSIGDINHRDTEDTEVAQSFMSLFGTNHLFIAPVKLHAQDTPADNWSQFRGNPRLTGVSDSKVPADLKLLWTYEAGDSIESSAAIVGKHGLCRFSKRRIGLAQSRQWRGLLEIPDR